MMLALQQSCGRGFDLGDLVLLDLLETLSLELPDGLEVAFEL